MVGAACLFQSFRAWFLRGVLDHTTGLEQGKEVKRAIRCYVRYKKRQQQRCTMIYNAADSTRLMLR